MKFRIRATYKNETFEFNLYDHARWLTLLYKTGGICLSKNLVFLKYTLDFFLFYNSHIVAHEAIHVYQARKLGWKYIPTYIWQALKAGLDKHKIPMEIEAYTNEQSVDWYIVS